MPLPAPRTWTDGEAPENIPSADDLNLDWRDSFNFLMGDDRPMGLFRATTTGQSVTPAGTFVNMNMPTEILKRGGITHSTVTNTHLITVPYTGQYQGFFGIGLTTISGSGLRIIGKILNVTSGIEVARANIRNAQVGHFFVNGSFTADLVAGDSIALQATVLGGTATSGTLLSRVPRLGIWYVGDYA
jgi:hypothetical protein